MCLLDVSLFVSVVRLAIVSLMSVFNCDPAHDLITVCLNLLVPSKMRPDSARNSSTGEYYHV